MFFRRAAQFLEIEQQGASTLYTDSSSAMKLLRRPEPGTRSKHVDMRYLYLKEQVDGGVVHLVHEGTDSMVADIHVDKARGSGEVHSACGADAARTGLSCGWC